jgi:hypothetical protein
MSGAITPSSNSPLHSLFRGLPRQGWRGNPRMDLPRFSREALGHSMLGIGRPDRHALLRITPLKRVDRDSCSSRASAFGRL